MPETFWVVEAVYPWSAIEVGGERPSNENPQGSAGFLPVFSSKEEAEAFAKGPGFSVAEIRMLDRVNP